MSAEERPDDVTEPAETAASETEPETGGEPVDTDTGSEAVDTEDEPETRGEAVDTDTDDEGAGHEDGEGDSDDAESEELFPGDDSERMPGLEKAPPVSVDPEHLKSVLESLLFVADKPLTDRMLAKLAHARLAEIRGPLHQLIREYEGRGIELVAVSGGYQFRSATRNAAFVRAFVAPKPVRLTRAQIETLSIVAYRQPVTRPEVDEIRGVDSGSALKILTDRHLVKILGRKDEPGRPLLYGTTPHFLEFFGLNSLKDLPTLQEFAELSDESRALFERRMGEPLDLKALELEAQAAQAEANAQAELFDADVGDEEGEEREQDEAETEEAADAADVARHTDEDDEGLDEAGEDDEDEDLDEDDGDEDEDEDLDDEDLDDGDDDEDEEDEDEEDDDEDEDEDP